MMKGYRLQVIGYRLRVTGALLLLCSISTFAQYDATGETTEQVVQLRVGAEFGKTWDRQGVKLSIGEELRFNLYDAQAGTNAKGTVVDGNLGASFNRSYTTLALRYMHPDFEYIKADAGYTLRLLGDKGWSDPNEFLRHRIFFGATAQYKMRYAKIHLRERALCDIRTDSVNVLEKNKVNWSLRSRIGADFYILQKPNVKPYVWCELENTLNVPTYQQRNGNQYISHVRTQAGVNWRVSKRSSLDFYYRFQYGYNRDINITKQKGYVQLTEETTYLHAIGIAYHFGW